MIGMPNINQYFKVAMGYPVAKLQAVMRGQDHSIPMIAAMAAFEVKGPMEIAAKAQEAMAKKSSVKVVDKLAHEGEEEKNGMLPDNLMMAMQQQQQGSLPENTGIGQLPAPNMQTMHAANGGIIAFDDGGYVPGYAGNDLFAGSDVDEEEVAALKDDEVAAARGRGSAPKAGVPEKTRKFLENKDKDKSKTAGRAGVPIKDTNIIDEIIGKPTPSPNRPNGRPPEAPALPQSDVDRLMKANKDMNAISAAPVARDTVPAPKEKRTGIAAVVPPQATVPGSKSDIDSALEASQRLGGGAESDYKAKLANYGAEVKSGLDALARTREEGKPTGQAYSGLEASLKRDEEAAAGKEAKNLQMALVNAGLAIAGGTSRYALENIGKGAMVGTKQYMEGVDKLEAAAKERQKAMAMIEQERRAEARGDWKEKNEFAARRTEAEINAKKYSIDGLGKVFEVDKKSATDLFANMQTNATRERMGKEQNATELKKTAMMADVYRDRAGAANNPVNIAMDNARQEWDTYLKDKTNMLKTPAQKALDKREIYERVFKAQGVPSPFSTGASPAGGGQRVPLSQRSDLFQ
jgi:hypothetical protein